MRWLVLKFRPARANAGPTSRTLARHRANAQQISLLTEYHSLQKKHETLTECWVNAEPPSSSRVSPQTKGQRIVLRG